MLAASEDKIVLAEQIVNNGEHTSIPRKIGQSLVLYQGTSSKTY